MPNQEAAPSRYPVALLPVLENFRPAFSPNPTDCPCVSEDANRQTREKLQCLYENLMSNNFRETAVLKKKNELYTKASLLTRTILLEKLESVTCSYMS